MEVLRYLKITTAVGLGLLGVGSIAEGSADQSLMGASIIRYELRQTVQRNCPQLLFDDIGRLDSESVRNQLLSPQGFVCALVGRGASEKRDIPLSSSVDFGLVVAGGVALAGAVALNRLRP